MSEDKEPPLPWVLAGPEMMDDINKRRKAARADLKDIVFELVYQLTDEARCPPRKPRENTESALVVNRYLSQCQVKVAEICERLAQIDLEEITAVSDSLEYYRNNHDDIAF